MRKRILVFSHEYPPNVGGSGTVAYQNATQLAAMGYCVDVLTKEGNLHRLSDSKGIRYIRTKKYRFWPFSYFFSDWQPSDYELIILNDPHAIYYFSVFFSQYLHKCLCYVHGSEPELVINGTTWSKRVTLFRRYYLKGVIKCRSIICVSKYMARKFSDSLFEAGLSVDKSKIEVLYAGVDVELFKTSTKVKHSRNEHITVFSCGRIIADKGYDTVAHALAAVNESGVKFTWNIAGLGDYQRKLEALCIELGINESVNFLGSIERGLLGEFYSSADMFILPSRLKESFSLVHLEAQAFGCPVVASKHSGMIESIKEGETGYYASDVQELFEIIMTGKLFNLDRANIIAFANTFTTRSQMEKMVQKYVS